MHICAEDILAGNDGKLLRPTKHCVNLTNWSHMRICHYTNAFVCGKRNSATHAPGTKFPDSRFCVALPLYCDAG